jgi:WD40 repeat protein
MAPLLFGTSRPAEEILLKCLGSDMDFLNNVVFSQDSRLLISSDMAESGIKTSFWGVDRDWALLNQQQANGVVIFSPDGRWLVTPGGGVSLATDIVLWDLFNVNLESLVLSALKPFVVPAAHKSIISNFAFSPDGSLLASVSQDSTAKVWELSPEGPSCSWF